MPDGPPRTRWQNSAKPRGDDYDARWQKLAESGQNIHGEADLAESLLREAGGTRVLDAGCGTGRVAIELATRGFDVTGVDSDNEMIATARRKQPDLRWLEADLTSFDAGDERYDLVLLAGNVMIFLSRNTEGAVLETLARHLAPGGLLVAGFQVVDGRLRLDTYDDLATAAGLTLAERWSTWDRKPYRGGDYAVSVHRAM